MVVNILIRLAAIVRLRLRSLFLRSRVEEELDEELRYHLERSIEENAAAGMTAGLEQRKEECRDARGTRWAEDLVKDVRYAVRQLLEHKSFFAVGIATLALGIGANTAIFSVVYAVLLRTPPYPAGERLVELGEATLGQKIPVTWINFQHWRRENRTFEDMSGFETTDLTLTGRGEAVLTHAGVVDASFFSLTGWRPGMGRFFSESEDRPGAAPTVVVTSEFWGRMLGGDPQVLGATLSLDGRAYQVIGVLPPGMRFFTKQVELYIAAGPRDGNTVNRGEHGSMLVLGRLKRGVTPAAARADLDAILQRLALADPGPESDHRTSIAGLAGIGSEEIRPTLLTLMGAVGLVLIIACANVASLLLVWSTARAREFAIRCAIGAGRSRIARQLFAENLVVAACGGVAGLMLATLCLRALAPAGPQDIPRLWEAGLNWPVLSFCAAVTVMTALLAGLAPIMSAGRVDLSTALKQGAAGAGDTGRSQLMRNGLVVAEIAVTLMLSFACGLLLRSLNLAKNSDPGFRSAGLLALELQLPSSRYSSDAAVRRFYTRLMGDLRRQSGVEAVSAVNCPPSTGGCAKGWYSIADLPAPSRAEVPLTLLTEVDPEYFHTMGIPLLAGRVFKAGDGEGALVVNEKLARQWWPKTPQLAVGHALKFGGPYQEGPTYTIAGVVASVRQASLDAEPIAEVYVPFAQSTSRAMVVLIRTAGDPALWIAAVRQALASVDRSVPVQSLRPFEERMGATLERRRFSTLLLEIFATLALALSAAGIYGILNYWARIRQKEIAIRLALGAQRGTILCWTGGHAVRLVVMGIVLGTFGCWGTSRLLASLMFGISARNPATLLAAVAVVFLMAVLAASAPAWRASRTDVIQKLRDA